MVMTSRPGPQEIRAKRWAWGTLSLALLLNALARIMEIHGLWWVILRTIVLVVFTVTMLLYVVLHIRRLRDDRRSGRSRRSDSMDAR
ncbi:hypothetical protein [Streptomyces sp. NPDC017941]|uniref:hypothetical protein n=1 Tax=Streptomyces sp. NPDC017941 TaxID=3365018 RepID=UPI0037A9353A